MFDRFNNNKDNDKVMFNVNQIAMIDLEKVQRMNNDQIQKEARKLGIIKK